MKPHKQSGQAISEYLILVALIAVGSIAVIQVLSRNIRTRLGVISEAIRGHKKELEGVELRSEHFETLDMGDFQDAIQDSKP